jgi:transcriptional regulator with XRE-family HTH domain
MLKKTLSEIGLRLRRIRLREDLTQRQLAEAAEIDLRNYQNIEQGKSNFRIGTLVKLAHFYHVPMESFFKGSRSTN